MIVAALDRKAVIRRVNAIAAPLLNSELETSGLVETALRRLDALVDDLRKGLHDVEPQGDAE
jgi:hypothetical protein